MSKLSPARKLALDVLMEADRRGMYARDVLSSRASAKVIDQRDSAFAARLALGVAARSHGASHLGLRDALSAYAGPRCREPGC